MLIALRRIERLDKNEYTDDDRVEAQDIYEQRRKDELAQQEVRVQNLSLFLNGIAYCK